MPEAQEGAEHVKSLGRRVSAEETVTAKAL